MLYFQIYFMEEVLGQLGSYSKTIIPKPIRNCDKSTGQLARPLAVLPHAHVIVKPSYGGNHHAAFLFFIWTDFFWLQNASIIVARADTLIYLFISLWIVSRSNYRRGILRKWIGWGLHVRDSVWPAVCVVTLREYAAFWFCANVNEFNVARKAEGMWPWA